MRREIKESMARGEKPYIEEMRALEKRLDDGEPLTEIEQARLNCYKRQKEEHPQEGKQRTDSYWGKSLMLMLISFTLLGASLGIKIVRALIEIGK